MLALDRRKLTWAAVIAATIALGAVGTGLALGAAGAPGPTTQSAAEASRTSSPKPTPSGAPSPGPTGTPTPEAVPAPDAPAAPDADPGGADPGGAEPGGGDPPSAGQGQRPSLRPHPPVPPPLPPTGIVPPPPGACANTVSIDLRSVHGYTSQVGESGPGQDAIRAVGTVGVRNYADTPVRLGAATLTVTTDTGRTFGVQVGGIDLVAHGDASFQPEFATMSRDEWSAISTWHHGSTSAELSWTVARPSACLTDWPNAVSVYESVPNGPAS